MKSLFDSRMKKQLTASVIFTFLFGGYMFGMMVYGEFLWPSIWFDPLMQEQLKGFSAGVVTARVFPDRSMGEGRNVLDDVFGYRGQYLGLKDVHFHPYVMVNIINQEQISRPSYRGAMLSCQECELFPGFILVPITLSGDNMVVQVDFAIQYFDYDQLDIMPYLSQEDQQDVNVFRATYPPNSRGYLPRRTQTLCRRGVQFEMPVKQFLIASEEFTEIAPLIDADF